MKVRNNMKQCCLNCVFCARCKSKLSRFGLQISRRDSIDFLALEDRKQAIKNNFDFLGKEIRIQKEWENKYNYYLDLMKKGAFHQQLGGGNNVLEALRYSDDNSEKFPLNEVFGLPTHPDAPDDDYLMCWHDLWNFKDNKNEDLKTLNQKNNCLFFYPYTKRGNKSFNGCEKERDALLSQSRFKITNWLVVIGVIVTIVTFIIQKLDSKKTSVIQNVKTVETMK